MGAPPDFLYLIIYADIAFSVNIQENDTMLLKYYLVKMSSLSLKSVKVSTVILYHESRFSMEFSFEEVFLQAILMSWRILIHEDETGPVLFLQKHNDWTIDAIQVIWAYHCIIQNV